MSIKTTRREFLKTAGAGLTIGVLSSANCAKPEPVTVKDGYKRINLGMASYTFRKFSLDDTLAMTNRLGLKYIAFKNFHLELNSTDDVIKSVAEKTRNAGLDLYGCGVVYMKAEEEVHQAFNYAKTAGMRIIIGVPNHELLPLVNKKVQEFDIKLAIHNHGPGDKIYPSPQSVYEKIKDLDKRIGLCIDVGHTQRLGIDPSIEIEKYADRLYDVHIKDVSESSEKGSAIEGGRGVVDLPKVLRTLLKINYTGVAALEYEKDEGDPLPGSAETIGCFRGILSVI